jgi:hypothetical protein
MTLNTIIASLSEVSNGLQQRHRRLTEPDQASLLAFSTNETNTGLASGLAAHGSAST